jgi:hypothetical protein
VRWRQEATGLKEEAGAQGWWPGFFIHANAVRGGKKPTAKNLEKNPVLDGGSREQSIFLSPAHKKQT